MPTPRSVPRPALGLGVVGAVYTNKSEATVDKAVPIARLIEEQEAILVPADSPFKTVDDFVKAWKADPDKVTIGGGSAPRAASRRYRTIPSSR